MIFSSGELAAMQTTQSNHMMDTCVHLVYSSATDTYGGLTDSYTVGDTLACGFASVGNSPKSRELLDSTDAPFSTHVMRLPHSTVVDYRDRFRITKRFGVTQAPAIDYEIVGPAQEGPSGFLLNLRKVTE